jgi:thiamine biosynthesis lipoprotein
LNSKPKPKLVSRQLDFEAIGTVWSIQFEYQPDDHLFDIISHSILARIEQFDHDYSRFRSDSLVTKMSQYAGKYQLPTDAQPLMDLYQALYAITNGKMTPLIGSVLEQAGYSAKYRLAPEVVTKPASWQDSLAYAYPELVVHKPVLLDFGAAGKGYLVDIIYEQLRIQEVTEIVINAGGDIFYHTASSQPLEVALEHPLQLELAIGVAQIYNQSICGSAGNRRSWAGYHHIIDPDLLTSPRHLQACWVIADSALLADGLTTALYFVAPEKLTASFNFEYALLKDDLSLIYSANFPATFFSD